MAELTKRSTPARAGGAVGRATIIAFGLAAATLFVDLSIPLGVAGGVPYVAVILVSLWSPWRFAPVLFAVVGSALTALGFYLSPPGGEIWQVLSNRGLALFAIWATAILSLQRQLSIERREEAIRAHSIALAEAKVLRGLLPICASCKKIRDDTGYWNQVESYLTKRTEAEFSHGFCPDCAKQLYGDYLR